MKIAFEKTENVALKDLNVFMFTGKYMKIFHFLLI